MTGKNDDRIEVAHVSGPAALRAVVAGRVAARREDGEWEVPDGAEEFAVVVEEAPRAHRTCAVCAADNDGARETCWNCGASLRRVR